MRAFGKYGDFFAAPSTTCYGFHDHRHLEGNPNERPVTTGYATEPDCQPAPPPPPPPPPSSLSARPCSPGPDAQQRGDSDGYPMARPPLAPSHLCAQLWRLASGASRRWCHHSSVNLEASVARSPYRPLRAAPALPCVSWPGSRGTLLGKSPAHVLATRDWPGTTEVCVGGFHATRATNSLAA